MRLIQMLSLVFLAFPAFVNAQETELKTLNLKGVDYVFTVFKTPEGKDFGYFSPQSRWTISADGSAVVYICWENYRNEFSNEHGLVQDAVTSTWQANSRLQFIGWQRCAASSSGIRIYVSEHGPHTKGLGRDLDGKPQGMVLNFTFNTWSQSCKKSPEDRARCIKSIAVHEFGHAIGFAHEHNRPDTPGECMQPAQGTSVGAVMLTSYDPHSVMNYCNDLYNNDGKLSDLDIIALHRVYG